MTAAQLDGLLDLAGAALPRSELLAKAATLCGFGAGVYEPADDRLLLSYGDRAALPADLPLLEGWRDLQAGWNRTEGERHDVLITTDEGPAALLAAVGGERPFQERVAATAGTGPARRDAEDLLTRPLPDFLA